MKISYAIENKLVLNYSIQFIIFLGLTYNSNYCNFCYAKQYKNAQKRTLSFRDIKKVINKLQDK